MRHCLEITQGTGMERESRSLNENPFFCAFCTMGLLALSDKKNVILYFLFLFPSSSCMLIKHLDFSRAIVRPETS